MAEAAEGAADRRAAAAPPPSWVGFRLDGIGGRLGRVHGVLFDSDGAGPRWLVVRVARFGRRTAVPYEFAVAGDGRVWVPFSRELIRSAPEVDAAVGLDPAGESELSRHYGVRAGARRRAEIEGRSGQGATAVPLPGR